MSSEYRNSFFPTASEWLRNDPLATRIVASRIINLAFEGLEIERSLQKMDNMTDPRRSKMPNGVTFSAMPLGMWSVTALSRSMNRNALKGLEVAQDYLDSVDIGMQAFGILEPKAPHMADYGRSDGPKVNVYDRSIYQRPLLLPDTDRSTTVWLLRPN